MLGVDELGNRQIVGIFILQAELPSLEAFGLDQNHLNHLKDMGYFAEGLVYYCHCHPPCLQPTLIIGTSKHVGNAYLTILMLVASNVIYV